MASLADMRVVRTIETRATTSGVAETTAALKGVAAAHADVARAAEASATVTETAARRQGSLAGAYERERRALDPLIAAREKYERTMRSLDRGLAAGADMGEYTRLASLAQQRMERVTGANDNLTRSLGLQRHEWINLGRQMQDVGTMALMGASPFQILASQGAQVYDVLSSSGGGVKGALKEVGTTLMGLVTPGRLAFAGIAAGAGLAAVAMSRAADQANEINKALRLGAGLRSGLTAGDIGALSSVSGLSRSEGRAGALAFAGAGASRANVLAAQGLSFGLAGAMYDGDVGAAQKGLSDAMRGGTMSLMKYVDGIRPLSTATSDWIERIRATEGEQAANAQLLRILNDGIKAAGIEVPLWRQGLTKLGNAASDLADSFLRATGRGAGAVGGLLGSIVEGRSPDLVGSLYGGGPRIDRPATSGVPDVSSALAALAAGTLADLRASEERGLAGSKEVRGLNATYNADAEALRKLTNDLASYNRLLNDSAVTSQMTTTELEAARVARDRLRGAVESNLTAEEKSRQSDELSLRSINARTDAEKAALAVDQKRLELAGQRVTAEERLRQAEMARTLELARSTKEAEDRLRASNDNLGLAGRLPYDRARAEIEQRYRRQNELNAGNPEALRRNAAAQANDLRALDIEQLQGPLRATTMSINEQIGALKVMKDSLYATDEQAATMAARQELVNAAIRAGIDPTKAYGGQLEALAAQMGKVAAANQEYQRVKSNIVGGMDEIRSGFSGMLSGITSDLVSNKGKNIGQIMANSLMRLNDQMMERLIFKPLTESLFGRFGQAGGGLFGNLLGPMFGNLPGAPGALSLPNITAPMATVNAGTVVVNGGIGGTGGGVLGINPVTGQPLQGAGSGLLGFGLGGAQSSGTQAVGSGLGSFGFGPNGVAGAGGDIMTRFMNTVRAGGVTNPYALAAIAATGKHESGFSAGNMLRSWSDPSASGEAGTSGGLMSWRGSRLSAMRAFTAGDSDPASAQARFFLQENPGLTRALQNAGSIEEANRLMANSWRFQGWDGGAEFQNRLGTSRQFLNQYGGTPGARSLFGPQANTGVDFDAASKSFAQSTEQASQSLTSLADATAQLPAGADAASSSLTGLFNSLLSGKGGGGGLLAGLFGGSGNSAGSGSFIDAGGVAWSANGNIMTSRGPMRLNMYEGGGIANSPQVSIFGEGRLPEAYVPLPDGRSIPVTMKDARPQTAPTAANSNAAPIHYAPTYNIPPLANGVTPNDVVRAIEEYDRRLDRQLPGRMANAQRRYT